MPPPLKMAIIGGGPSAFYVASRLLQLLPRSLTQQDAPGNTLRVHMFDRLWTPHGLVRYGVAPDHPEVKNCTHKFDEIATQDPRFSFFGNVNIGRSFPTDITTSLPTDNTSYLSHTLHLELSQILTNYTHLLIATGSPLSKLHPSLFPNYTNAATSEGSLKLSPTTAASTSAHRVVPALSLVHWYTQHPSNPAPPPLESTRHVTLIGMGNVALDVARMLLSGVDRFERGEPPQPRSLSAEISTSANVGYDIPASVLSLLRRSNVEHVSILGRRGPLEAAFTARELREMVGLEGAKMKPIGKQVLDETKKGKASRQQGRILQLLEKASASESPATRRSWSLQFFRSPSSVRLAPPDANHDMKLELEVARTRLDYVECASGTAAVAVPTGETEIIPTDMVVTSLGFEPERWDVYDELVSIVQSQQATGQGQVQTPVQWRSGRIPTDSQGRVRVSTPALSDLTAEVQNLPLKNVYASGWASMGARGVLAATMADAYGVAETIVRDFAEENGVKDSVEVLNPSPSSALPPTLVLNSLLDPEAWQNRDWSCVSCLATDKDAVRSSSSVSQLSPQSPFVTTYQDWKRIDNEEVCRGMQVGKERERMNWGGVVELLRNKGAT